MNFQKLIDHFKVENANTVNPIIMYTIGKEKTWPRWKNKTIDKIFILDIEIKYSRKAGNPPTKRMIITYTKDSKVEKSPIKEVRFTTSTCSVWADEVIFYETKKQAKNEVMKQVIKELEDIECCWKMDRKRQQEKHNQLVKDMKKEINRIKKL